LPRKATRSRRQRLNGAFFSSAVTVYRKDGGTFEIKYTTAVTVGKGLYRLAIYSCEDNDRAEAALLANGIKVASKGNTHISWLDCFISFSKDDVKALQRNGKFVK
jgi:hypothetical protein